MKRFLPALVAGTLVAAGLSGCAAPPSAIAPAYTSQVPYESYTCKQLGQESQRIDAALTTASAEQDKARQGDTVGVIFLGLPVSSLSGQNVAPQIASLKGQQDAVQQVMIEKNCSPAPSIVAAPAPAAHH